MSDVTVYYINHVGLLYRLLNVREFRKDTVGVIIIPKKYKVRFDKLFRELINAKAIDAVIYEDPVRQVTYDEHTEEECIAIIRDHYENMLREAGIGISDVKGACYITDSNTPQEFHIFLSTIREQLESVSMIDNTNRAYDVYKKGNEDNAVKKKTKLKNKIIMERRCNSYQLCDTVYIGKTFSSEEHDYGSIEYPKIVIFDNTAILPYSVPVDFQTSRDIRTSQLLLLNSRTRNARSMLVDQELRLMYQMLLDYYGNPELPTIIKYHPNNSIPEKHLFDGYDTMNDMPVEFMLLDTTMRIPKAITIDSYALMMLKSKDRLDEYTVAGEDFYSFKDILPQVHFVCHALALLNNKYNRNVSIVSKYKDYFDGFLNSHLEMADNGEKPAEVNILFDNMVTEKLNLRRPFIIISNTDNVGSCADILRNAKIKVITLKISNTGCIFMPPVSYCTLIMNGIFPIPFYKELAEYTYDMRYSGLKVSVHSIENTLDTVEACSSENDADAFKDKMRNYIIIGKNIDEPLHDWLLGLIERDVWWALRRYYEYALQDEKYLSESFEIAKRHIQHNSSKLHLLELKNKGFEVEDMIVDMMVPELVANCPEYLERTVKAMIDLDYPLDSLPYGAKNVLFNSNDATSPYYIYRQMKKDGKEAMYWLTKAKERGYPLSVEETALFETEGQN